MSDAKIVKLAETEVVSFGPLAHYQPIIGDDEGTTPVRTGIQTSQPGYVAPVHSHPYLEILHILDGTAEAWLEGREDEKVVLGKGDTIALPPGAPHSFRVVGDVPLRLLGTAPPTRIVNIRTGVVGRLYTPREAGPQWDSARGRIGPAGLAGRCARGGCPCAMPQSSSSRRPRWSRSARWRTISPSSVTRRGPRRSAPGIQTSQPGYVAPVHSHPYLEILHILDGTAEAWLEGREDDKVVLGKGDTIALPAGAAHSFRVVGDVPLRLLGTHVSPTRIVDYRDGGPTDGRGYRQG